MSRSGYAEPMVAWIIRVVRLLIVLASRHRSLALENLALRQQLALYRRTRPKPTMRWSDRLFWVGLRAAWRDWKSALVVVRPATVVAWHRRGFAWYWTRRSRPRGGRPQVGAEIRRLTREMARANPLWGAPRIHGELLKLGFEVSERTVSRLMPRRRTPPSQTWRTFLENHLGSTVAIDFFAVPTLTCRILFVFVVLAHDRRRILHVNVTRHPTSAWTRQQLREAFSNDANARFLLHDRDTTFDAAFGAPSTPSVSRPSARHLARLGRIPTSNASSARSAASVWTTSSSSMSGIFVASFGPTSRTTSGLARTSRSARMLRWHAPSNRPAASVVATRSRRPAPPLRTASCLNRHGFTPALERRRVCGDLQVSRPTTRPNSSMVYVANKPVLNPRTSSCSRPYCVSTARHPLSRGFGE